jgi:gentisate 1,2-dioxygenase
MTLMEAINGEAAKHNIWVRTQANAPAQRPWFSETSGEGSGELGTGRVAVNQMKTLPHMWKWEEYCGYLAQISEIARKADVSPIEFADRQSILLLNPGLNGRLQVTNTIRCAISIYNPGDVAPVHLHSPNASRTILSNKGGYTVVEGERVTANRGDLTRCRADGYIFAPLVTRSCSILNRHFLTQAIQKEGRREASRPQLSERCLISSALYGAF